MIAVLADDLSGAAEMAGLGRRHGLPAEILHRGELPNRAPLLIYDTDSRNRPAAEARRRVRRILERLLPLGPEWFFKKTDSVLRGNVLAEIEAAMGTLGRRRAILAPANPAAGRLIRGGEYFIHDRPLHLTDFRHDPRHPRLSHRVADLLGRSRTLAPVVLNHTAALPERGLIVGEAGTVEDMRAWAGHVNETTLAAGGAEFFRSMLLKHGWNEREVAGAEGPRVGARMLFVCGSLAESAKIFLQQCRTRGWPVLSPPEGLFSAGVRADRWQPAWAGKIIAALREHPKVVMATGGRVWTGPGMAERVGRAFTGTARRVLKEVQPDYICVEGGATAVLLAETLGWRRLVVAREFATGVVGLKSPESPGLMLVVKPGSYGWPDELPG